MHESLNEHVPIQNKNVKVNEIAQVGDVIAVIEIDGPGEKVAPDFEEAITPVEPIAKVEIVEEDPITVIEAEVSSAKVIVDSPEIKTTESSRFYSPLVKNIAKEEGITLTELETVRGTGDKNRVTKKDILGYIAKRTTNPLGKSDGKVPDVTPIVASGQDQALNEQHVVVGSQSRDTVSVASTAGAVAYPFC